MSSIDHTRPRRSLALLGVVALIAASCAQAPAASPTTPATATPAATTPAAPTTAEATAPAVTTPAGSPAATGSPAGAVPAPFDTPPVPIALVRQLGSGDYFEQWLAGAQEQAEALRIDLRVSDARGDNAAQATNLETAVNQGVKAIIVDHGHSETLKEPIARAVEAGIPVVAFDVNADHPDVPQIEQSDAKLAQLALDRLVADTGGEGKIGYVYVAGFAPLDRRNEVFQQVLAANPGLELVATFGRVSDSTAADVQAQAAAVLTANPGIEAIFAPYDEFAKGAVLAIEAAGLQDQVKVYGADISTADIAVMTAPGSPWVATAGTDPANVGRVAVRAAALIAAGEEVPHQILVEPALITQEFLRDNGITTMEQLSEQLPELDTQDLVTAPWFSEIAGG